MLEDVIDVVHRPERRHEKPETVFSSRQGQAAQIVAVEREAIEEDSLHRHAGGRGLDLARVGQGHARLEPLEARPAPLVEGHDLPVDHEVLDGQREKGTHQVRIAAGDELAAASVELHLLAAARGQHADAVELDLEEPALVGGRPLVEGGEHEGLTARRHLAPRSIERIQMLADGSKPARHVGHLLHRETGEDGLRIPIDQLVARGRAVRLLEEEPIFL